MPPPQLPPAQGTGNSASAGMASITPVNSSAAPLVALPRLRAASPAGMRMPRVALKISLYSLRFILSPAPSDITPSKLYICAWRFNYHFFSIKTVLPTISSVQVDNSGKRCPESPSGGMAPPSLTQRLLEGGLTGVAEARALGRGTISAGQWCSENTLPVTVTQRDSYCPISGALRTAGG